MLRQVNDIILNTVPQPAHSGAVSGFDVMTNTIAPNVGTIFYGLPSLYGKHVPGVTAATMLPRVRAALAGIKDANVIVVNPPPVQGLDLQPFQRIDLVGITLDVVGPHGNQGPNILIKQNFAWSANGGYQHWWSPQFRSTIAAGIAEQDVNAVLVGPTEANSANHVLWNAFANIVWSPVAFITTGFEYMYGRRITVANAKGQEQVIIGKFRVAF